ncbi:D-alanyl-D-alanine carboxypeptidase family protein, partial [Candidatus Woesearchaeota archaeon]|nr:D-alanyl-D-alanine carboxypeptidase family protein [Candidatus Woesearchaeota archaeon]
MNYDVVGNTEIIGRARNPLVFDILKEEGKPVEKKPFEIQIEQKKFSDFSAQTELSMCAKGVRCTLTEDAYNLIVKSHETAQNKYKKRLIVNSAYRSQEEQIAIWKKFASTYPDMTQRRKKVCDPINGKCPHTTGNAVDVVFDGKTTKTMSNNDWRILHNIMSEAGWVRYGEEKRYDVGEPWHFECCGTERYNRAKE